MANHFANTAVFKQISKDRGYAYECIGCGYQTSVGYLGLNSEMNVMHDEKKSHYWAVLEAAHPNVVFAK
jgi:hypothetical protein